MPIGKPPNDRSHALRGNESMDALRPLWDAERPGLHSHAERGNDHWERLSRTISRNVATTRRELCSRKHTSVSVNRRLQSVIGNAQTLESAPNSAAETLSLIHI